MEYSYLAESSKKVLGNILQLHIVDISISKPTNELINEKAVSGLHFTGDYNGYFVIVLKNDDIKTVSAMTLKRFGIEVPLDDHIVFSELINIFTGNLTTELLRVGKKIDIEPPREIDPQVLISDGTYVISLTTDEQLVFKFFYKGIEP